jgi:hypothetical protein
MSNYWYIKLLCSAYYARVAAHAGAFTTGGVAKNGGFGHVRSMRGVPDWAFESDRLDKPLLYSSSGCQSGCASWGPDASSLLAAVLVG